MKIKHLIIIFLSLNYLSCNYNNKYFEVEANHFFNDGSKILDQKQILGEWENIDKNQTKTTYVFTNNGFLIVTIILKNGLATAPVEYYQLTKNSEIKIGTDPDFDSLNIYKIRLYEKKLIIQNNENDYSVFIKVSEN